MFASLEIWLSRKVTKGSLSGRKEATDDRKTTMTIRPDAASFMAECYRISLALARGRSIVVHTFRPGPQSQNRDSGQVQHRPSRNRCANPNHCRMLDHAMTTRCRDLIHPRHGHGQRQPSASRTASWVGALIFETGFVAVPRQFLMSRSVGDIGVTAHHNVAMPLCGRLPASGQTCRHRIQKAVLLDLTTSPRLTGVDIPDTTVTVPKDVSTVASIQRPVSKLWTDQHRRAGDRAHWLTGSQP